MDRSGTLIAGMVLASLAPLATASTPPTGRASAPASTPTPKKPAPFAEPVREAATAIDMVPVPASADGGVASFWISRTEIPWEVFDVFVYRLDVALEDEDEMWADTTSRPSKPYLPPDRGFGHQGYAAISLTHHAATMFCRWLSERTGRSYRLPTEDEWERAARLRPDGTLTDGPYAIDVRPENLGDIAWYKGNSRGRPHPIGTRPPTPLGLHDLHGNVAEWVNGRDGSPTTKGGSYRDTPKWLAIDASVDQTSAWNATDPQIPKSTWWLSDGPMVGFRIVCDAPPGEAAQEDADAPAAPTDPVDPTDAPDAPDQAPPATTPRLASKEPAR